MAHESLHYIEMIYPSFSTLIYISTQACVQSPSVKWPAPIHCAVPIFSKGIQDPDLEVKPI